MIGDRLDQASLDKLTRGHCPVCSYRGFVLGPRGGAAQNIECGNLTCRARFNVTVFGGRVLIGEAIERERDGGHAWPTVPSVDGSGHDGSFS